VQAARLITFRQLNPRAVKDQSAIAHQFIFGVVPSIAASDM
jgi:hypothetical protein